MRRRQARNGASSSILKMYGTELNKLRQELFMAIGATDALNFDTDSKGALVKLASEVRPTLSKAAPLKCSSILLPNAFLAYQRRGKQRGNDP